MEHFAYTLYQSMDEPSMNDYSVLLTTFVSHDLTIDELSMNYQVIHQQTIHQLSINLPMPSSKHQVIALIAPLSIDHCQPSGASCGHGSTSAESSASGVGGKRWPPPVPRWWWLWQGPYTHCDDATRHDQFDNGHIMRKSHKYGYNKAITSEHW